MKHTPIMPKSDLQKTEDELSHINFVLCLLETKRDALRAKREKLLTEGRGGA